MDNIIKKMTRGMIINLGKKKENRSFDKKPIIIGACPRTGTTLLLSILSSYPQIYGISRQSYAFTEWQTIDNHLDPVRIDRLYRELILKKIPNNNDRWCEKTPKNIQYLNEIFEYFGDSIKFIHLVRDGRDVVTSKHPKHTPDDYWVSPERWVRDTKRGLAFANHPNLITVRYEDIIYDFDPLFQKISDFLEIDFVPDKNEWIKQTTLKHSKHWGKPVQAIHSDAIKKWQRSEHKKRIDQFYQTPGAPELLKELHYE